MRTILLLAVFSGKLDDPAPISQAVASHKLDDPEGWPPRVVPVAMRPAEHKPAQQSPAKPQSTPPAAPPKLWQLKDRSGRTWTSPDPRWLQTYVGRVNASLATQYTSPVLQYGSPCANGACQR